MAAVGFCGRLCRPENLHGVAERREISGAAFQRALRRVAGADRGEFLWAGADGRGQRRGHTNSGARRCARVRPLSERVFRRRRSWRPWRCQETRACARFGRETRAAGNICQDMSVENWRARGGGGVRRGGGARGGHRDHDYDVDEAGAVWEMAGARDTHQCGRSKFRGESARSTPRRWSARS